MAKEASGKSHVVFVTAYDSYAVAAFEQGAVDYVMKPFSPVRLPLPSRGCAKNCAPRLRTSTGCSTLWTRPPPRQEISALDHRFARRRSATYYDRRDLLFPRR